jgi:hypothetical protein
MEIPELCRALTNQRCTRKVSSLEVLLRSSHPSKSLVVSTAGMSHSATSESAAPAIPHSCNDHIQDLCRLLEGMALSGEYIPHPRLGQVTHSSSMIDSPFETITWRRKTVEETITLSRSPHMPHSSHAPASVNVPAALSTASAGLQTRDTLPSQALHRDSSPLQAPSSMTTLPPAMQFPSHIIVPPKPSEIQPPRAGLEPEGFWVITVGQEVGIFYHWYKAWVRSWAFVSNNVDNDFRADVAEQTNFISGNIQKSYPSFQKALEAYTIKYSEGRVRAVPTPGGPFWPSLSPPSPSSSDELWAQVEDLSGSIAHCQL